MISALDTRAARIAASSASARQDLFDQAAQLLGVECLAFSPQAGDSLPQRGGSLLLFGCLEQSKVIHVDDGNSGLAESLDDVLGLPVPDLVEHPLDLGSQVRG